MTNVLLINHNSAEHLGGAERSMLTLLDEWVASDPRIAPLVVSPGPAPAMSAETDRRGWRHERMTFEGWAVFSAEGGRGEQRLRERAAAEATRTLVALLREHHVELVITNTLVHPWGAIAAAIVGIPHVWFVREFGHADQGFIWPGGRATALRQIGELSHRVVANSVAVRDDIATEIDASRLVVSYPPIDTEAVRMRAREPLRAHPSPYPDASALRVCVLGRVTRSKGQWRVVEALRVLDAAGTRVQVCFVGELLDPGIQTELTRGAPPGSVTFAGEQQNPFPYVAAAHLAVIPSQREAFGRTTVECLAIGRPVVTTRDGAGAELITAEVGMVVDGDSILELAEAIGRYANDRSLARRQEAAARRRAVELMTGEFAADRAVTALRDSVGAPPATLPAEWAAWAQLLDATADGGSPRRWRVQASIARGIHLGGKAVLNPKKAWRRLRGD